MTPHERSFYLKLIRAPRAPFQLHTRRGPHSCMVEARESNVRWCKRMLARTDTMPSGRPILTRNARARITDALAQNRAELSQLLEHERAMSGRWDSAFAKSPAPVAPAPAMNWDEE